MLLDAVSLSFQQNSYTLPSNRPSSSPLVAFINATIRSLNMTPSCIKKQIVPLYLFHRLYHCVVFCHNVKFIVLVCIDLDFCNKGIHIKFYFVIYFWLELFPTALILYLHFPNSIFCTTSAFVKVVPLCLFCPLVLRPVFCLPL